MAINKLPRVTQQIFGQNAPQNELAVFGSMSTDNPIYSKDIDTLTSSSAYLQGFQNAVVDGESPFLEETNGLFYAITNQLAYIFQNGIPEWNAGTTYFTNGFCQYLGKIYQSTIV